MNRILLNIGEKFDFNEFKKIFGEKKGTDVVEINYIKIIITKKCGLVGAKIWDIIFLVFLIGVALHKGFTWEGGAEG